MAVGRGHRVAAYVHTAHRGGDGGDRGAQAAGGGDPVADGREAVMVGRRVSDRRLRMRRLGRVEAVADVEQAAIDIPARGNKHGCRPYGIILYGRLFCKGGKSRG